jgi:Uma2 family endonuclease
VLFGAFGRRRGSGGPSGENDRWWLLPEPELHLEDEDPIVPDIAGWRMDRLSLFPHGSSVKLPPDWACEVLSPSTEGVDRTTKMDIYAAAGVPHVWLVDPLRQLLQVFRIDNQATGPCLRQSTEFTGDQIVRAAPFEALELDLSEIWPPRS